MDHVPQLRLLPPSIQPIRELLPQLDLACPLRARPAWTCNMGMTMQGLAATNEYEDKKLKMRKAMGESLHDAPASEPETAKERRLNTIRCCLVSISFDCRPLGPSAPREPCQSSL